MDQQPYRLWLRWQQMHYPPRGLPATQTAIEELLAVDGIVAGLLEPYFEGGRRGRRLDPASRPELEAHASRLDALINGLDGEAAVYFGRLRRLIALALVDQPAAGAVIPRQPEVHHATSERLRRWVVAARHVRDHPRRVSSITSLSRS